MDGDGQTAIERILVRLPNWVGDVVMATPALRALRRRYPDAAVTAAVKEYAAPLLQGSALADDVLVLGDREEKLPIGAWRFARRLRERRFDAAFLLTNSLTSAIPPFLAGIPRRIGYSGEWRGPLLTTRVPLRFRHRRRTPEPMPAYYQRLLDEAGVPPAGPDYELPCRPEDVAAVRARLEALGWRPGRPLAALNPGARFGASKLWAPERFAEVARHLRDARGFQVVVLCGPGEESLCRQVTSLAGAGILDSSSPPIELRLLRPLMDLVDILVTTDSGPRHIAVAAGKPVVVIMGPTHPQWTAWNLERTEVVRHDVPCGPCHLKACPTDHRCMDLVTVTEVLGAIARVFPAAV